MVNFDVGDVLITKVEDKRRVNLKTSIVGETISRENSRNTETTFQDSIKVTRSTNPICVPSETSLQCIILH